MNTALECPNFIQLKHAHIVNTIATQYIIVNSVCAFGDEDCKRVPSAQLYHAHTHYCTRMSVLKDSMQTL